MNPPIPPVPSNQLQRGASLLEVLVALVLLSVGMMGIFALHTRSMIESRTVFQETLATLHAQDAAELLWLLPCFSIERADSVLAQWRSRTETQTTLPEWQPSYEWVERSRGFERLVIHQEWAQRKTRLSLTFSVIKTPCPA
jgi:type IV pilus assembly protein PilV